MHFLCLHGMGTNSRIFEAQTAAIRYTLGSQHTFKFLDGAVPAQMAASMSYCPPYPILYTGGCVQKPILMYIAAIEPFVSASDNFLQYVDEQSEESCRKALSDLERYIVEDGPFGGVMAFSQGAGLAPSLLIHQMQKDAYEACLHPLFRYAVFFSGGVPKDPRAERGEGSTRLMWWEDDGELIGIPTLHVWAGMIHCTRHLVLC